MPRTEPDLAVTLESKGEGQSLLSVSGELDYNTAPQLRAELDAVSLHPGGILIIDLSGLTYCDSTGISVMVGAQQRAKAAGTALALAGVNPDIIRIFRVISLHQVFSFYENVEAATRALTA
jgi:anti-sigma B factor antagonist